MFMIINKKMEKLVFYLSLFIVMALSSAASAESKFVRPDIDVPVRRGKGKQYKILKFVKDGDQVEFFKENGDWAKVRVQGGTEGWMLKRYLSDTEPPAERIKTLREENEQLKQNNSELSSDLTKLKDLQVSTSEELEELQASASEERSLRSSECDRIQDKYKASQEANRIIWFFSGAGVLFAGCLIGRFSAGTQKKRNRLF
jgi:SH3 domain protein